MPHKKTVSIIAAIRTKEEFEQALCSDVDIIFDLNPDILSLIGRVQSAHASSKKIFIHMDLAEGIGKDKHGIMFAKKIGVDGIISTRVSIIKTAREAGLFTVQRFFIVDSQSILTTIEAFKSSRPNMIEIMPGIVTKAIRILRSKTDIPIIAGGLIDTEEEISEALKCGISAVSTGKQEFWFNRKDI